MHVSELTLHKDALSKTNGKKRLHQVETEVIGLTALLKYIVFE